MYPISITKEQAISSIINLQKIQGDLLRKDKQWTIHKWTFIKEITAAFGYWSIRQSYISFCPKDLEIVLKNLSFFLWEKFRGLSKNETIINDGQSMAYIPLILIFEWLNEFIIQDEECFEWSYLDSKTASNKGYIDLRALIHNTCICILEERIRCDSICKKI